MRKLREKDNETIVMWSSLVLTRRCISTSTSTSKALSFGWFDHVKPAPKDPIIGVTEAFLADPSPNKINLGVVIYIALVLEFLLSSGKVFVLLIF